MRIPCAFLSLPPSLLLFLATQLFPQTQAQTRDEKRNVEPPTLPTAVRKMSPDESEKFMPEYYAFAPMNFYVQSPQAVLDSRDLVAFRPPFPRHYRQEEMDMDMGKGLNHLRVAARNALARLEGREFSCPGGTHVCSNIAQLNYCCADGTTCFEVENAPDAGNVGCCPDGLTCGGSVAACDGGNTACPAAEGGGCCIPGFVCASAGCIATTITPTTTTETFTSEPTSTTEITTTSSQPPTLSTPSPTPSSTSSSSSPAPTNTGTGLPPVRPTSSDPDTESYCPTGFYPCLATAGPGCCRTGRDCQTTSCAPISRTTIITNGATIVVPLTEAQAYTSALDCASGWFLCGKDAGPVAGCCPRGYACGTASCTLSAPKETITVQKEFPGDAVGVGSFSLMGVVGWVLGLVVLF